MEKKKRSVAKSTFNLEVLRAMSEKELKDWWKAQNFDIRLSAWGGLIDVNASQERLDFEK